MPTIHRAHGSRFGSFDHPDRYDRWASRFFGGLYERVAADVAAAGLPDGARVLDVGTGPGRVPLAIARALPGLRVEGLDLSYADATFDLVVSTMSQHHWADAAAGLRELRRVLRPGAQVWIYDVRFALGRAEAAARAAFPSVDVRRESLRTGWLPLRLLRRLVIDPAEARV